MWWRGNKNWIVWINSETLFIKKLLINEVSLYFFADIWYTQYGFKSLSFLFRMYIIILVYSEDDKSGGEVKWSYF